MSTVVERNSGGIGFLGLLTIVFVILKATGYIAWSWWWVFSPLWIPWVIILGIVLAWAFFYLIACIADYLLKKRNRRELKKRNL